MYLNSKQTQSNFNAFFAHFLACGGAARADNPLTVSPKREKGIPFLKHLSVRAHTGRKFTAKNERDVICGKTLLFPWSHHKPLGRVAGLQQKGYCLTGTICCSTPQLGHTCKWQDRREKVWWCQGRDQHENTHQTPAECKRWWGGGGGLLHDPHCSTEAIFSPDKQ